MSYFSRRAALRAAAALGAFLLPLASSDAQTTPPAPVPARSADGFVDSIGVAMHLNYKDTAYGKYKELLLPRLKELGVRHFRDGFQDDAEINAHIRDLAKNGIKATLLWQGEPMDMVRRVTVPLADCLEAIEGPNETDLPGFKFQYEGQKWPEGSKKYQQDLYRTIRSEPKLNGIPVLTLTMGWGKNAEAIGDVSPWGDGTAVHFYTAYADAPGSALDGWHLKYARVLNGDSKKPIVCTETSYSDKAPEYDGGVTPKVQGRYVPRLLAEHFRYGIQRTFLYEFVDTFDEGFGLLRKDNTPRIAFTSIKNLIQILRDPAPKNAKAFTPASLPYTLTSATPTVHQFLLQKRDGTFYLVVWNDAKGYDNVKKIELDNPPVPATVTFAQPMNARLYVPETGTTGTSLASGVSNLTLSVPDHLTIVELTPVKKRRGK